MALTMLENKVAIIPIRDPDKSPGGIWIPEEAKERVDQGVIGYTGPDCELVNPGDYVMFPGYSGQLVDTGGDGVYIIMRETDIVALLDHGRKDDTLVNGLYFRERGGVFHLTTVDFALRMIAKALEEAPWRGHIKSRARR